MVEIRHLESKMDQFIAGQHEHNSTMVRNIEKLTETMMTQQAQQVEINQLNQSIQTVTIKQDNFSDRLSSVETNQAVNNEFKTQVTQLKWVTIGAATSVFVGIIVTIIKVTLIT